MCGIAGVARRDGSPITDPNALAAIFSAALAHRGPDGSGVWTAPDADVLLVHRRLAIIDLSADAAQPMMIDGRHVMVFNGEVYNYRELRAELEGRGVRFRTASDTEVLLRLIATEGPDALARVRGMFALAYWNGSEQSLLLARDRFGIKPLYVAAAPGSIAFASELQALRSARLVERRPSPSAVLAFLSWGSVPPPLAWNDGAEMLPPGSWFQWGRDGRERRGRFADSRAIYAASARAAKSERELRHRAGAAVRDSVRAHLVSDVPVGLFLSGGVDSGALASAAASLGASLQTYTVIFDHPTSEAGVARTVAAQFGASHHELRLEAREVVGDFADVLTRLDQPTIDAVNSYYVSRAVAKAGIKAVLSGAGGDEMFGGYPAFRRIPGAVRTKRVAGPLVRAAAPLIATALPRRLKPRWRHFAGTNGNLAEVYRTQRGFFLRPEISALAGPALLEGSVWTDAWNRVNDAEASLLSPAGAERTAAGVARLETRLYLGSQLLRDIDVMSMAHGLEVRLPFVDHELASAIWPDLAAFPALMRGKRLLHETLERPLPPAVTRRAKQGFVLPFDAWMHNELAPIVRDGLDRLARSGFVHDRVPDDIWQRWRRREVSWSRPWGLAVLGAMMPETV
jgi:asparagine synthase (glutamine-hydrolysing)